MFKKVLLFTAIAGLVGCGSDDNDNDVVATESLYVTQLVAADYSSSQLATGKVSGDRTATQNIQSVDKSDYRIDTYENILYHIGRFGIDEISRFDAETSLANAEYTYSVNDNEPDAGSSNPHHIIQNADDNAYVIRYGNTSILQVNPQADSADSYVKARIDLSDYTVEGAAFPRMQDAVIYDNKLFVGLQRLDASFQPKQAYVAVIDLSNNEEIDTNPQTDGLKGIPVNAPNISNLEIYNDTIYVAGRGNYGSSRDPQRVISSGGLVSINASSYQTTNLVDADTFSSFNVITDDNNTSNDTYFHVTDVTVSQAGVPYVAISIEQGFTTLETKIIKMNNSVNTTITDAAVTGKEISDITFGPEGYLWTAIADSSEPQIVVIDSASDSQHGDSIELDMPPTQIEFLIVEKVEE